jgi:hypothetical protein
MSLHWIFVLPLVGLPLRAAAEESGPAPSSSAPTEYRFGDDMVHGSQKAPSGEVLYVRTRESRESLVRVREHWLPELYQSIEDL